jgi:ABC-type sulfate transport system substrate-binding protein
MNNPQFPSFKKLNWSSVVKAFLIAFVLFLITYYSWQARAANRQQRLIVYAFSTQEEVMTQAILPSFEKMWEEETGQDLEIEAVFGSSGTLVGQIVLSAPADVALFSSAHHVDWLKLWNMVRQEIQPEVIGFTPMVIVTRQGNPHGITKYEDLSNPGIQLIHGNPRTSGSGEWGILAEYGSALIESNDPQAANSQLRTIWQNVKLLGPSARAALTLFELGVGDALITYEQDARLALERGVPLEIIIPPHTLLAQHVAVVIDKNVTRQELPVVQAFMDYLLSSAGQEILATYHLRPVSIKSDEFSTLSQAFTVDDLGDWKKAYDEVIDAIWLSEIEPHLDLYQANELLELGE